MQTSVCPEGIPRGQTSDFSFEEEVQYTLTIDAEKTNKKILGLKIKRGEKRPHSQSPGDYSEA